MKNRLEILFADDDEEDRMIFRESLLALDPGINLTEASDGLHLMEILTDVNKPRPHIIFIDINMPKKNGIECLRELRSNQQFSDVPVIMFTTSASQHDVDETYACGANLYVRKAYSFPDGIETLRNLFMEYQNNTLMTVPKEAYYKN